MTDDTHGGQTQYRTTPVTEREVCNAVKRRTPAGTTEIADILDVSRQAAAHHLHKLADEGPLWSKKVGPTRVWLHEDLLARDVAP